MDVNQMRSPYPGAGDLHNDSSNGSILQHVLTHTGSEQCWALMSAKPEAFTFVGRLGTCTITLQWANFGTHSKPHWLGAMLGANVSKT